MTIVHPHALKHGLSRTSITFAWENYYTRAIRVPGEIEVRLGFDQKSRDIEMVGSLLVTGDWLVYHALTPPTDKVRHEINRKQRRY